MLPSVAEVITMGLLNHVDNRLRTGGAFFPLGRFLRPPQAATPAGSADTEVPGLP